VSDPHLLRLGSRASPLARTQAEWVASRLPVCPALVWIRSSGDLDRQTALRTLGGTGVFTAELHQALHADRIDAAVHSLKDLPTQPEDGILLTCVPEREDPRDALVARHGRTFETLPTGARVGTGSPRRAAQLRRRRPDLEIVSLRGNVETRIRQVDEGRLDAVVLALAGLKRLGLDGRATEALSADVMLPAAGQGALGITTRAGDAEAEHALAGLRDVRSAAATTAERAVLLGLGAGCHAPVGTLALVEAGRVRLVARVFSLDGQEEIGHEAEQPVSEAHALGLEVARVLLERGAGPLVEAT
jgi:hydroxymethylbilane synthase